MELTDPREEPEAKLSTEEVPATGDSAPTLGLAALLGGGATSVTADVHMRRAASKHPSRSA